MVYAGCSCSSEERLDVLFEVGSDHGPCLVLQVLISDVTLLSRLAGFTGDLSVLCEIGR